jgi:hypothetical protein
LLEESFPFLVCAESSVIAMPHKQNVKVTSLSKREQFSIIWRILWPPLPIAAFRYADTVSVDQVPSLKIQKSGEEQIPSTRSG